MLRLLHHLRRPETLPGPPFPGGIPAWRPERVAARLAAATAAMAEAIGLEEETFDSAIRPTITNFTDIVHLLPAAAEGRYAVAGGLFRLAAEGAVWAVRVADSRVPMARATPVARRGADTAWRAAAAVAMLCRSLPRTLDMDVVARGESWLPLMGPLYPWCRRREAQAYAVGFHGAERQTGRWAGWLGGRVVAPATLEWLAGLERGAAAGLVEATVRPSADGHPVARLVAAAEDTMSGRADHIPCTDESDRPACGDSGRAVVSDEAERLLDRLVADLADEVTDNGRGNRLLAPADDGLLLLRYPDALRPYGAPAELAARLNRAGWAVPAPDNPLQIVRMVDGMRAVVLTGEAARRLRRLLVADQSSGGRGD